jgi:hypothetical protein
MVLAGDLLVVLIERDFDRRPGTPELTDDAFAIRDRGKRINSAPLSGGSSPCRLGDDECCAIFEELLDLRMREH